METSEREAGRDLDAEVAEKVMGWRRSDDPVEIGRAFVRGGPLWTFANDGELIVARRENPGPWSPSTDIAAAFEVVEKMEADGWGLTLMTPGAYTDEGLGPQVAYSAMFAHGRGDGLPHDYCYVAAPSVPLAICRAALAAVEEEG